MYRAVSDVTILRLSDSATIPIYPGNVDYDEALLWLASNTLLPKLDEPVLISQVTMRQAQLALLQLGLLDQVEAMIAVAPRAVRVAWGTASIVLRDDPIVLQLATALSLDLAALFTLANTL